MTGHDAVRASIITRRTYNRPLDDEGAAYETWPQTVSRVVDHQRWLWERAVGRRLASEEEAELAELHMLVLARKSMPSGRTLWMGGTETVRRREASNFNCSGAKVHTVHDTVDIFWLLLQGCGTGFKLEKAPFSGFARKVDVEVVPSTRPADYKGRQENVETFDRETGVWTIKVGDSAEAWAKSAGKLLVGTHPARKLVLDFSEIRGPGQRIKGYGWICSGYANLAQAYQAIAAIRNRRVGRMLTKIDLLDVLNWLGTVLSTRRSAQAALMDFGDPEWEAFATAKPPGYWDANPQRAQSNNGLMFWEKPTKREIRRIFDMMIAHGGGEPSFNNAAEARRRAPWFEVYNPCYEILLANHGFCNLVENDVAKFRDDHQGLHRAVYLSARANYRQTLVNLKDGVLQSSWHENNEFLRLCGVGLTGLVRRPDLDAYALRQLRNTAVFGAYSMADELGTPRPKNVTCVKPSGTLSKIMGTTEGVHKPLGRYVFNNVSFSRHDPLVPALADANYHVFDHPSDRSAVVVRLPVSWPEVPFDTVGGVPVNVEPAVAQLERYRTMQASWSDQNTSITVSYDPSEVKAMVDWFDRNWDGYVGVAFLFRNDHTKTAADLGFAYLPQEIVDEPAFREYASRLLPVDVEGFESEVSETLDPDCATGACPVR